eukprot:tig00000455_g1015.t1
MAAEIAQAPPSSLPVEELSVRAGDSITAAVARAVPEQTIRLAPGRYKEKVVLEKDVHIIGPADSGAEAVIECEEGAAIHCKGPAAPSVRGVTIRGLSKKEPAVWITDGSRAVVESCSISRVGKVRQAEKQEDKILQNQRMAALTIATGGNPIVRGNKLHGSECGVVVASGGRGTIEGNDVYGNKSCIVINGDSIVRGNKIHDSKVLGLTVGNNGRGTIENNDVYGNKVGIMISNSRDSVVRGNRIHDNKDGLTVSENSRGTVEGNDVHGNDGGIVVASGADPVVRGNKVHDNKIVSIGVFEDGRGTIEGNDPGGKAKLWDSAAGPCGAADRARRPARGFTFGFEAGAGAGAGEPEGWTGGVGAGAAAGAGRRLGAGPALAGFANAKGGWAWGGARSRGGPAGAGPGGVAGGGRPELVWRPRAAAEDEDVVDVGGGSAGAD